MESSDITLRDHQYRLQRLKITLVNVITDPTLMRLYADTLLYRRCDQLRGCENHLDDILCVATYLSVLNNEKQSFNGFLDAHTCKSAKNSCFTKLEALMPSICLFGLLFYPPVHWLGPSARVTIG